MIFFVYSRAQQQQQEEEQKERECDTYTISNNK
jgi:hypothetical protein